MIDKGFAVQAMSPVSGDLARTMELKGHPAFDLHNPNRVRSLVAAFAQANPVCFHACDGSGYGFLADIVIELNAINPQVASRMMGAFTQWSRYDQGRQRLMKRQVNRILLTENLSMDVYEIARKTIDH